MNNMRRAVPRKNWNIEGVDRIILGFGFVGGRSHKVNASVPIEAAKIDSIFPVMVPDENGGSIILTGSGVWQKGIPIYATYGATKAALRSFARTWTADLASKGIRANLISPGPIETPILKGQFGDNTGAMKERFKTMIPMGRIGKPEEIASAAVFLASDESSYISGIDLPVDGGLVAV